MRFPIRHSIGWRTLATAFALALTLPLATRAQHIEADSSHGVNVTIYNQNFGLVRDIRSADLKEGINHVSFEDVAAQIDPTTVSLASLTAPNAVTIREQNYQYDLIDTPTILSKSIGKSVKFKQFADGQVHEIAGILLNAGPAPQGLVVKTAEGVVLNPSGQIELAELPKGLLSKPSLLWKLQCDKPGKHECEIAYQTGGLNWHCDYVLVSNPDDTKADLTSWVTLDNQSGATYKNAALKLIAGDVHRVESPRPMLKAMNEGVGMAASVPQFREASFAEYHLYTLKDKTDINNRETKQLTLFSSDNVPTNKIYVFDTEGAHPGWIIPPPRGTQKIKTKIEIQNTEANQLGMPMPKGRVRVYKKDSDGALQFVGEDEIDHTPKGEKIRVYLGDAFDLVGERTQTNVLTPSKGVQRASYEVSLRNHKDSDVTITDVEHAGGTWKIIESSQPYTKKDSRTFEFDVNVPANGETKVDYTIETKF